MSILKDFFLFLFPQHSNTHLGAYRGTGLGDLSTIQCWQEGASHGRAECQNSHLQHQYSSSFPAGVNGPDTVSVEGEATD